MRSTWLAMIKMRLPRRSKKKENVNITRSFLDFEKVKFIGRVSEPLDTDDSFLLENDEMADGEILLPEWSSASNNNLQPDDDLEIGFNVGEDY
jgi:hypothetical protein